MQATVIEALSRVVYFSAFDEPRRAQLAERMIRQHYLPGETLFLEGDPTLGMWIIEHGRIKIFKLNPNGEEHVLRLLGDGDTFNEIGALDGGANPANAGALSETTMWVLPSAVLQNLIATDGAFALKVVQVLSGKVRGLVNQIENLTLYSVMTRLARFLLQQAADPSLSGPGVTRATIAAHLATTPQTVSTTLRDLEAAGAIRFDRHMIEITDERILRSIAML
ncbi:MAG: Crp/Fnr family transcriptional regulator [Chloroflexi bacterium]|nr:Crp/Fnr family transcriptional regulator [Chloroflexota bacterium]